MKTNHCYRLRGSRERAVPVSNSFRSKTQVPVAEIRALYAEVERTHDSYWGEEYDRASREATLRRNAWTTAIRAYENALVVHAPALLDAYESADKAGSK